MTAYSRALGPVVAGALGLAALTVSVAPVPAVAAGTGRAQAAVDVALRQVGDPYAYGGNGPNAFDCSGLIDFATAQAGMPAVPRTSAAQARYARRIAKSDLRAGDLMFFYDGGGVYHAAMFLRWHRGAALMVHAPGSGGTVRRAVPWTSSWFAGTVR